MSNELLFLNRADLLATWEPKRVINKIHDSLEIYLSGDYLMPDRLSATYDGQTIVCMPAFCKGCCGEKVLTITPENVNRKLPSIYGMMVVNDSVTGKPLAIFDGGTFTALRTGAVGAGVAMSILAPKNAHKLGLIGCGVQGYYHILYACTVREIDDIYLFNIPKIDLTNFINMLKDDFKKLGITRDIKFTVCESSSDVAINAEVIITTTTSPTPVFPDDKKLFEGKTIIGVGSYQPTTRDFPDAIFGDDTAVFVEMDYVTEEAGELAIPIKNGIVKKEEIHHILDAEKDPKLMKKTNFFKTVGMALYDVVVAEDMYKCAVEKNLGQKVNL